MRYYLLLSTAVALLNNSSAYASNLEVNLGTHKQHLPLELKSTPSFYDKDTSFKVAAICALGDEECGLNIGFSKADNDTSEGAKKCRNAGYPIANSCPTPKVQGAKCPYHPNYAKPCYCPSNYIYTTANCPAPKLRGGGECDGKAVSCYCPATISLSANEICTQKCDGNCISKSTCSSGYVPNSAKDRCLNNNPPSGSSFSSCNSCQVQTNTGVTEAGNRYYSCRAKNCSDGGYNSSIPSNNKCSSTNFCSNTCYYSCYQPACSEGGYNSGIPSGQVCSSINYYGRTCYTSCYTPCTHSCSGSTSSCNSSQVQTGTCNGCGTTYYSCRAKSSACPAGYSNATCNSNQVQTGTAVAENGTYCYSCRNKTCADGGYNSSIPSGQTCDAISYTSNTCYTNCKNACAAGGSSSCYGSTTACDSKYETTSSTCKDCSGSTRYSCKSKVCEARNGNNYFLGRACSYWAGYTGSRCVDYYQQMGAQCYKEGNIGKGDCDVDSWRACCEECNGST